MDAGCFADLTAWITAAGLEGQTEMATLTGFCERVSALGLALARGNVVIDTLHPIYEGRAFTWKRNQKETVLTEFGRSDENLGRWERSPYYYFEISGESLLRRRLTAGTDNEFPVLADLRAAGMTDYLAMTNRFAAEAIIIGGMDCVYSSWATNAPTGFQDDDIATLARLVPLVALTLKSASLTRIADTLVETYLGRDAGRKVLGGRIARGVADRIDAVLWFSDLRNYTRISDTAAPEQIIPLLNKYADATARSPSLPRTIEPALATRRLPLHRRRVARSPWSTTDARPRACRPPICISVSTSARYSTETSAAASVSISPW
jgi:adenylate cyclase